MFQSTLPHGERPDMQSAGAYAGKFQSTLPHGERRSVDITLIVLAIVSIHAPTWGATGLQWGVKNKKEFQSTLPYGERL